MFCLPNGRGDPERKEKDKRLNRILKEYAQQDRAVTKILLLGAGESGKSTVFKQVKIIHQDAYTPEECAKYKDIIISNVYLCMQQLLRAARRFQLLEEITDDDERAFADQVLSLRLPAREPLSLAPNDASLLSRLWQHPAIQQCYSRRSEFQLYDSCKYYLDDIHRLAQDDYSPTQQDVLRARVKTLGVVEDRFEMDGIKFLLTDVGGQRGERRKWIHAFDNVSVIIFVVGLSGYDQKLAEDNRTNRMEEALRLFGEVVNNRYFRDTDILVFFNKNDLFKEKIQHTDLAVCFPEYTGGCHYDKALQYIKDRFLSQNKNKKRSVYTYVTCATDTSNMRVVLQATRDILLNEAIDDII
eukprot:gb/GECH01009534.1/.p1 GENE.gb/GECH01009534.1/~~gb/GECH01009534.1/.p1  ORF type:complete len:356 (+),score=45.14 gb/GECH01009534.1/:1-1068(+)